MKHVSLCMVDILRAVNAAAIVAAYCKRYLALSWLMRPCTHKINSKHIM